MERHGARAVVFAVEITMGLLAASASQGGVDSDYFGNVNMYEAHPPILGCDVLPGFHGRFVEGLEWVTPNNAVGDEAERLWRTCVWRNERAHGQFVVWTDVPRAQLRAIVTDFVSESGAHISASRFTARFVRYVHCGASPDGKVGSADYGDCLDTIEKVDMPRNSFRPVWLTVNIPADVLPGIYRGKFILTADSSNIQEFPVEIEVINRTLPTKTTFYLDLWTMPWSVARYHGVEPYSALHFELLRPYFQELASAGQGAIMAIIVDDLWPACSKQDSGQSMIGYKIYADGHREYDFSVFDRYVEFAKKCGIGPQIHCYSFARFQDDRREVQTATFIEGETGLRKTIEFHGFDDPAWEAYWGPLALRLDEHAREKGWIGDVYIAIDEMSAILVERVQKLLTKWAPGLRLQFANDKPYAGFEKFRIENYSQAMRDTLVSCDLLADLSKRRAAGWKTTFYVCDCLPWKPNTWMNRPATECEWIALYAAAKGFDGFLRWAAFRWRRDPFFNVGSAYTPGEAFFFYPGCRASVRWELLREGIENFDKIRILSGEGRLSSGLVDALKMIRFSPESSDDDFYSKAVRSVDNELRCIK